MPGRVSTEVDARLSFDTQKTVEKGRYLISQYNAAGITNDRVLIKIASTWEGIKAAEILQKEGINCNLTLLFGMHQAVACAEAGVRLISPFVGRILDWYKKAEGKDSYPAAEDPGVVSVTKIFNYYKKHGYKTQVMGASFRNLGEITELAGCDLLTIAPNFLGELSTKEGTLPTQARRRQGDGDGPPEADVSTRPSFRKAHEADKMAHEKLDEGIAGLLEGDPRAREAARASATGDASQGARRLRPRTSSSRRSTSTATASSRAKNGPARRPCSRRSISTTTARSRPKRWRPGSAARSCSPAFMRSRTHPSTAVSDPADANPRAFPGLQMARRVNYVGA